MEGRLEGLGDLGAGPKDCVGPPSWSLEYRGRIGGESWRPSIWGAKVVEGVAGGLWGLSWGLVGVSGVEPETLGWAWELKEQIGSGVWKAKIEGDGDGGLWERNLKCRRGLWRGFVVLEQGLANWGRGG